MPALHQSVRAAHFTDHLAWTLALHEGTLRVAGRNGQEAEAGAVIADDILWFHCQAAA